MIVRILGEGQYSVPDSERGTLEGLDVDLAGAVDSGDEDNFRHALTALAAAVRKAGNPLADDAFAPSDLVVPFADATLRETKSLLADSSDSARADDHGG